VKIGWYGLGEGALADNAGVVEVAGTLERAGFESAWIGEHPVLVDPQTSPSPVDPTTNLIDPMVALTAAAAVTERLILGAGVLLLPLHELLALAKQLSSLDYLSSGRVIVGVGVGYVRGESDAIGVDFATRGRRADDGIDAMRAMWTQPRPAHDGQFYRFGGVQSYPRPVRSTGVPILGGGMSLAGRTVPCAGARAGTASPWTWRRLRRRPKSCASWSTSSTGQPRWGGSRSRSCLPLA